MRKLSLYPWLSMHGCFEQKIVWLDICFAVFFVHEIFKCRVLSNIPTIYGTRFLLWCVSCPFLDTNVNLELFVACLEFGESSYRNKQGNILYNIVNTNITSKAFSLIIETWYPNGVWCYISVDFISSLCPRQHCQRKKHLILNELSSFLVCLKINFWINFYE